MSVRGCEVRGETQLGQWPLYELDASRNLKLSRRFGCVEASCAEEKLFLWSATDIVRSEKTCLQPFMMSHKGLPKLPATGLVPFKLGKAKKKKKEERRTGRTFVFVV